MKSILRRALAAALLGSVAVPALAADLPSRLDAPAIPAYSAPAPIFSWGGYYVGVEFGGQGGKNTGYLVNNKTGYDFLSTGGYSTHGVVGGGLVGYNYQVNQFVVGIEGDIEGSSNQGRYTGPMGFASINSQYGIGGGIRGRVGYAPSGTGTVLDRALIYATGGWALEDITQTYNTNNVLFPVTGKNSNGRSGYTLGGGAEYAFTPNWVARVEYRYTDYGRFVSTYNNNFGGPSLSIQQYPMDNAVRAGLIYKFAAPAPVLARY